jgi:hypothetical protein
MNQQKIEQFALCQFLCDFPDSMDYHSVLDLILDEDESISIWQPFEDHSPNWVVNQIEEMVTSMNYWFKEEITNE